MSSPWKAALDGRLAGVLAAVPLPSSTVGDLASKGVPEPLPVWVRLTLALHEAWCPSPAVPEDHALADLVWGQYALFLWIRLQDDLLDGHHDDLRLQFLADRFLLDGLESLDRVPGLGAPFRAECRARLRDTTDAILEVGRLQSRPGAFTGAHLPLHAHVGAVFRIGPGGVCHRLERTRDLEWVGELQAQFAISSQVIDDLEDLIEDVNEGRFSFVANVLAGAAPGDEPSTDAFHRRLAEGLMHPAQDRPIGQALTRAAQRANHALPGDAPPLARELALSMARAADALPQRLHEGRVRTLFGAHRQPHPA